MERLINALKFVAKYHIVFMLGFILLILTIGMLEALNEYQMEAFFSLLFISIILIIISANTIIPDVFFNDLEDEELEEKSKLLKNYIKEKYIKGGKWKRLSEKEMKEMQKAVDRYYEMELRRLRKYDIGSRLYDVIIKSMVYSIIYLIFFLILLSLLCNMNIFCPPILEQIQTNK